MPVAAERLIFAQRTPDKRSHLGRLALADFALDTLDWYRQTLAEPQLTTA